MTPQPKLSWFERLRRGLARSSSSLSESIGGIFTRRKLDDDTLQDLEDVLIQADLDWKRRCALPMHWPRAGTARMSPVRKSAPS